MNYVFVLQFSFSFSEKLKVVLLLCVCVSKQNLLCFTNKLTLICIWEGLIWGLLK